MNHPVCPADIIGEHTRGKSGIGIVGPGNHLVFIAEGEHRHHRPEDLFLHDGHVVGAVGENGRFHEIAALRILRLKGPSAVAERGAFGQPFADVTQHQFLMLFGDQRAEVGVRVHRVTGLDVLACALQQALDKARVEVLVHKHPGTVGADLALGVEVTHHGGGDGVLQVRVVENDQRRLATQFHGHVFQRRRGGGHHLLAGAHLTGERHLGNLRVMGQPLANFSSALHHVEHARRHTGFDKDFRQLHRAHGRFFGGFEDHGVAAGQGRGRLPAGDLDRIVPGTNARTDAQRLPPGVIEIAPQILLVTFDGRRQAGKELNGIGTGHHIHSFRFLPGFTGITHFHCRQLVVALAEQGHRFQQNAAALNGGCGGPLGKTGAGALDGGLLHRLIRHFHFIDHLARGRIHHREGLAGAVGQKPAVDKVLNHRKRCRHSALVTSVRCLQALWAVEFKLAQAPARASVSWTNCLHSRSPASKLSAGSRLRALRNQNPSIIAAVCRAAAVASACGSTCAKE